MNAHDLGDLQDLVGVWSCLAIAVGFAGVCFCHFSSKGRGSQLSAKAGSIFAASMLVFSLFVVLFVLPVSVAYSGPVPSEVRQIWRYDKYFAALIAFVFAAVFVYDSRRVRRRRNDDGA